MRRAGRAAFMLAVAAGIQGCGTETSENAVTATNASVDAFTISLYETYAGGYHALDPLPAGESGAIRHLPKGRYVVTIVHHIPATISAPKTDVAVTREADFTGCCDTKDFEIHSDFSVSQ